MIKQTSIDEVLNCSNIHDVASWYTTLKANVGCCPLHDEKSPSFRVNLVKQIFKCFGCGKGGDAFTLVMAMENLKFNEAVEFLAARHNITLEYDQASQQQSQEVKDQKADMLWVAAYANQLYQDQMKKLPTNHPAKVYLQNRGYDESKIIEWQLGYAPDEWKFLTSRIIEQGKYQAAFDMGLVSTKEGNSWDFHRNRITMPIHDQNGIVVGIASRMIPTGDPVKDKDTAKWFNPAQSLVYDKKKIYYGLWQAQRAIKKENSFYLVEGYFDLQAMHDAGMLNTIAASGTEVDKEQAKYLKRYADEVILTFDADEAGINKQMKHIDIFLKLDFKVVECILPSGMDPHDFIQSLPKQAS